MNDEMDPAQYEDFDREEEEIEIDEEKIEQLQRQVNLNKSKTPFEKHYQRPEVDITKLTNKEDLFLMQVDCDYYISKSSSTRYQYPGSSNNNSKQPVAQSGQLDEQRYEEHQQIQKMISLQEPIIRMFCVNERGNSVLLHVKNFEPYFYIPCPSHIETSDLEALKTSLNEKAHAIRTIQDSLAIKRIVIETKESVKQFQGKDYKGERFLKIYTQAPSHVAALRTLLERGITFQNQAVPQHCFESNMPFALRFMIDKDIVGMGWVKVDKESYKIREANKMVSRCQIEVDVDCQNVIGMPAEGEWGKIAPIRIFSFDIECCAEVGFPTEKRDPIIQIASVVQVVGEKEDLVRAVHTLDTCNNIPGAHVFSHKNQRDMLLEWEEFVQWTDPDFFLGYNITNFDFPYILNRAEHLQIRMPQVHGSLAGYGYLGRILNSRTQIKEGKYLSQAMGMRDTKEMNFQGRIQLDMLMHMHREHKLSSYTLNNVSYRFLKEQQEDVHHSIIKDLQKGDADTRKRLAVYCLKDAQLPLKLMEKLMCLYNYAEMARVTGVPVNYLFIRGQQIKVASQLYRKARKINTVIPSQRSHGQGDKYDGAFVLDPKQGYYKDPIATLDFASLYPSIMMAHNLCYSTLIEPSKLSRLNLAPDEYARTPHGDYFVKPHVKKGILPLILEELIAARKKAKNEMAVATDEMTKAVLDGRQLALKVSANSVYGFTGAQVGQLPCLEIASSVTAYGRQMIEKTRDIVLSHFTKKNGYEYDSDVIYGDTDSVMVKFGVKTVEEAMKLGKKAADMISGEFIKPIQLEFEQVYYPYLLISKKRYAGVYYSQPDKYDKIDTKGMENVRRDNCMMIRNLMNKVLDHILIDRDEEKAKNAVIQTVSDLLQNKLDISMLVITKSISKGMGEDEEGNNDDEGDDKNTKNKENQSQNSNNYQSKGPLPRANSRQAFQQKKKESKNQYKANQAHVELAQKMNKRDPGVHVGIGDRIPYIIIVGTKLSRNYENAEDPIRVLKEDLPIDFQYYLNKQLKPPILRIMEHVISNPEGLFSGEHTNSRYIPKVCQTSGIGKFLKVKKICLGCRGELYAADGEVEPAVCEKCQSKEIQLHLVKILETKKLEEQYAELWVQCQRCQGSLHDAVICSNRDCPIFYQRTRVQQDIDTNQRVLERFDNQW